jgi:uncharacterized OB-fold protein
MNRRNRPFHRTGLLEDDFWRYVASGEVRVQQCSDCSRFRYPPGPCCPSCLSDQFNWLALSGRGRILSWVTFHKQYFDEFPPPHTVIAAQTEEGPILIADLVVLPGIHPDLRVDADVRLEFSPAVTGDIKWTTYCWRMV